MQFDEARAVAARCHRVLEPLHALIYFAPEAREVYPAAGLERGRMHYFASRSAAMGRPGAATVAAAFYNFNPRLVEKHIPRAWTLAEPSRVLAARFELADVALRRLLGDAFGSPEVAEAAELAREAAEGCTAEGRPLYAGHAELDWPAEPHLVLWHAATLLREYRGDGHIAALVLSGLSGLHALVTHTATGTGFLANAVKASRDWTDEEWDVAVTELQGAGLLDADGGLTDAGRRLRQRVEDHTDEASTGPWRHLGAEKTGRLAELGRSLSRTVVAAGAFPDGVFASPRA